MMWGGALGMGLGMLFVIALPVLLVIGAVYIFSFLRERDMQPGGRRDTPQEILDLRLAKGEISLEVYEELRKQLE
jgi:uncharacterized membrane protein